MKAPRILIVEDERALSLALAAAVRQSGAGSEIAPTAALARRQLEIQNTPFSAMILDIGLPDQNGLDFLASLPKSLQIPSLVITAHGEIENTIAARKLGVSEFLTKPLDFERFKKALHRLLPSPLPESSKTPPRNSTPFIGASPAMRPVFQQIAHACTTTDPILISGETGTGKSLAASLIVQNGSAAGKPCIIFQPGPGELSQELKLAIDQASDGVLILENIEQLDLDSQTELLRRWAKDHEPFPQLIATTSSDLCQSVAAGQLRSDLYYRLQVLEVKLPALRERLADLPALFDFFLGELKPGQALSIDDSVIECLQNHDWQGNIRELRNVASHAITVSWGNQKIERCHLPTHLSSDEVEITHLEAEKLKQALDQWISAQLLDTSEKSDPTYSQLAGQLEQLLIQQLLNRHDGKLSRLASKMKANRSTLRKKINAKWFD
ncbi:MAG: sigma 54-interacting transcriptional regulator [Verrucomicrobiales bacterium]|nr:sigma 54-interacting transcriptional regulator [Verrucomicrobiales bacterium]